MSEQDTQETRTMDTERAALLGFAGHLLALNADDMSIDDSDVQDAAVKYGLVREARVLMPCREHCVCAEVVDGTHADCLLYTAIGKAALAHARATDDATMTTTATEATAHE